MTAEAFIDYARVHREALSHNKRLWKYCDRGRNPDCFEPELLNRFCALFPFQTMKTVRLRVNMTRALLEDDRQVIGDIQGVPNWSETLSSAWETLVR